MTRIIMSVPRYLVYRYKFQLAKKRYDQYMTEHFPAIVANRK